MIYKDESNVFQSTMETNYEKNMKYDVINICGTKYKVIHKNSSSIKNNYLICLGQLKYFIKIFAKCIVNAIIHIRDKYLFELADHVADFYGEIILALVGIIIIIPIIYGTLYVVINELSKGAIGFKSLDSIIYNMVSLIFNIIKKLLITYACISVGTISILMFLSAFAFICTIVKNIFKFIYSIISNGFNKFYRTIPDVEKFELTEIVIQ